VLSGAWIITGGAQAQIWSRAGDRPATQRRDTMPRIPTPANPDAAPAASRPLLDAVKLKIGVVPNLYLLTATSPAALRGLIGLAGALDRSALEPALRERLALAVAEIDGCGYCLAAHSFIGRKAGLSPEEIAAAREGRSAEPRAAAALGFATAVVRARGRVGAAAVEAALAAGLSAEELVEVVAVVALNTFTNYLNEAFGTELDFPAVAASKAA
jgi:uncharacterized peroxidase-related enzyme